MDAFALVWCPDWQTRLEGMADVPAMLRFYRSCGLAEAQLVKFFIEHDNHTMFEDGQSWVIWFIGSGNGNSKQRKVNKE